jgi:hypothetical protein
MVAGIKLVQLREAILDMKGTGHDISLLRGQGTMLSRRQRMLGCGSCFFVLLGFSQD